MKILILCTGNSCRSQMAEGFLSSFDSSLEVYSAGISPAKEVHPKAVRVMAEIGIDLLSHKPKLADEFLSKSFDFVITVCDDARAHCPVFLGNVKQRLHLGFDDPAKIRGSEEAIYSEFRRIRDEIGKTFHTFYKEHLMK